MLTLVLAGLLMAPAPASARAPMVLSGRAMWIWYLANADGGSVASIIGTMRYYHIREVVIKSADSQHYWSQLSRSVVDQFHAAGLKVCAWQYVYGNYPRGEAWVGALARNQAGADCLMIDAEAEYEGKYASARTYMYDLRYWVGPSFPLVLASFPYVDYHPGFPYSVFLGPGGAQYNEPQMYWDLIGTTPDTVFFHTYSYNRVYERWINPLGDLTQSPPASQVYRFRQLCLAYGAPGVAWWEWSQTPRPEWAALAQPISRVYSAPEGWPSLSQGAAGDLVVWAQEHLYSAGYHIQIDGQFGPHTRGAVISFQRAHGIYPSGVIGGWTWQALLRYQPVSVNWTSPGAARPAAADGAVTMRTPKNARLPAKRYEIPRHLGAG